MVQSLNLTKRIELQEILEGILGNGNVYFQPPTNVHMKYPAIVYNLSSMDEKFANNGLYQATRRYTITVIDRDPDTTTPDKIAQLPLCSFNRHYIVDSLNHYVYNLYY